MRILIFLILASTCFAKGMLPEFKVKSIVELQINSMAESTITSTYQGNTIYGKLFQAVATCTSSTGAYSYTTVTTGVLGYDVSQNDTLKLGLTDNGAIWNQQELQTTKFTGDFKFLLLYR